MKHAVTRTLFAYWDALRRERSAPERAEIDPAAIRAILADTFIIEIDESRLCPFRLAGTRVSALVGKELKGASFTSLWAEDGRSDGSALIDISVNERCPVVASVIAWTRDGGAHDLELLLLPLRHRGKTHARMLGSLSPLSVPPRLGVDPVQRFEIRSRRIIRSGERVDVSSLPPPRERIGVAARPERRGHLFVFTGGRRDEQTDALKRR